MDTITHALAGAAIGYAGFRQRGGRIALWTAIAAAEFPDADLVMLAGGAETYLQWHRTVTHSILVLPFWAAMVAGIFWAFSRRADFKMLWCAAAVSLGVHILLDWLTTYGTIWLWPLSNRRFELSWVFIVDPYVWLILGATLWAAIRYRSSRAARTGLAVLGAYFLICGGLHRFALRNVEGEHVAAFPQPLNPFRWTIVRNDGDTITWRSGEQEQKFIQFKDEALLAKAEATRPVKVFRWFAEFPLVEQYRENGKTVLRYRDIRFRSPLPWGGVREGEFVVAKVFFDANDQIIEAGIHGESD